MENIFYTYIYLDPRKSGTFNYGKFSFKNEPFYVGKGHKGQSQFHLSEAKNNKIDLNKIVNKHKYYKIKGILDESLEPIIIKFKETLSEQDSFNLERILITTIGRSDLGLGPLTNLTDGGEGTKGRIGKATPGFSGRKHSKETKMKMRESTIRTYEDNPSLREITGNKSREVWKDTSYRKKMTLIRSGHSNPFYGKTHTEEFKNRLSKINSEKFQGSGNPMYGRKQSEETKRKISEARKKHYVKLHQENV